MLFTSLSNRVPEMAFWISGACCRKNRRRLEFDVGGIFKLLFYMGIGKFNVLVDLQNLPI